VSSPTTPSSGRPCVEIIIVLFLDGDLSMCRTFLLDGRVRPCVEIIIILSLDGDLSRYTAILMLGRAGSISFCRQRVLLKFFFFAIVCR
jgi:hypothetical protein